MRYLKPKLYIENAMNVTSGITVYINETSMRLCMFKRDRIHIPKSANVLPIELIKLLMAGNCKAR